MTDKAKVINYYKKLSIIYDKKRLSTEKSKIISDLQIEWFIKNLENKTAITCLEIGCGTGRLTKNLIDKTRTLITTDASPEMIKINQMTQNLQKNDMAYVICDAVYLPFRSNTFTDVAGARVLWHIKDYLQAIKEALRVLNNNGSLLFDFPCLWGPSSLYSKFHRITPEVLMLYIDEKTLEKIFKKNKNLTICGNTSAILSFIPDKLLKMKIIKKIIYSIERMNKTFLKNWLYSYYLVKITK